jgi:dienelactone hydrolase
MKRKHWIAVFLVVILLVALSACGGQKPAQNNDVDNDNQQYTQNTQNDEQIANNNAGGQTQDEGTQEDQEENNQEDEAPSGIEPPYPQIVEIPTEDGRTLEGYFYPAGVEDAPLIVLMHWAPGSQEDWEAIAPWLQNRPVERGEKDRCHELAGFSIPEIDAWTDDSWFPKMPEEVSFAVLIFNFGGYGESEGGRATFLNDALSAVRFAASLPGIDPDRIATLGASIGADGAADACYLYNQGDETGTCIGAFSLSPGNYITDEFTYMQTVSSTDAAGYPAWCLAAEDDGASPTLCRDAAGDLYRAFIFPGSFHGMLLIEEHLYPLEPPADYDTMQLIQEWLEQVFDLSLNDFSID